MSCSRSRLSRLVASTFAVLMAGCGQNADLSQYKPYDQLPSEERPERAIAASEQPAADREETQSAPTGETPADVPAGEQYDVPPVSALVPVNVVDGSAMTAVLQAVPRASSPPSPTETANRSPSSTGASPLGAATPGTTGAGAITPAQLLPGGIQLLVPHKEFRVEGPQGAWRVSYDDLDLLKVLNMEPVPADADKYFPDWLRSLNGRRIRIRGFMYPQFESTGIERFVLARDNQICCFGRDPKVYDLIEVSMAPGRTTDFILGRPFDVVGVFHIDLYVEEGKPLGLYRIDEALVIDR